MSRSLFVNRANTIALVVVAGGTVGAVLALLGNVWTIFVSGQPVPLETWIESVVSEGAEGAFLGLMLSFLFFDNPKAPSQDSVLAEPLPDNEMR